MGRLHDAYLGAFTRMQTARWRLAARMEDQRGQTTTEYLVIAGVLAAVLIGVLTAFGPQITTAFGKLGAQLSKGAGGGK